MTTKQTKQTTVKTNALNFEVTQGAHGISEDAKALFNAVSELATRRFNTATDISRKIGKAVLKPLFVSKGEGTGCTYALESLINDPKPSSKAVRKDLMEICSAVGVKFADVDDRKTVKAVKLPKDLSDATTWQQIANVIDKWQPNSVNVFMNPPSPEKVAEDELKKKARLNGAEGKTEDGIKNVKKCMIRSITRLGDEYSSPVLANLLMLVACNADVLQQPITDIVKDLESKGVNLKRFDDIK